MKILFNVLMVIWIVTVICYQAAVRKSDNKKVKNIIAVIMVLETVSILIINNM